MIDALALGCWAAAGAQKTLAGRARLAAGGPAGHDHRRGRRRGAGHRVAPRPGRPGRQHAVRHLRGRGQRGAGRSSTTRGYPTAGTLTALVVGAGLCLLARWRGWILPSGDAWSPLRVVPRDRRGPASPAHPRARAPNGDDAPKRRTELMTATPPTAASAHRAGPGPPWQEDFYRHLHQHPELSHEEQRHRCGRGRAASRLRLRRARPASAVPGSSGSCATATGPTVLLRADMDALPVREQTGLPYASTVTADRSATATRCR